MDKKLKVGVVGCGQIADGHISEIKKLNNSEVVALCDIEKLMAEQAAIRYGISSYYDNFEEMLNEQNLDVVHITTPPQSHFELTKIAVDAGCHVYVEKPVTPTYEDTVKLIEYVKSNGKKLTVGWNSYFDPPAVELREMVNQGVIGQPLHAESFFGYGLSGSFGKAILGSNKHWVHALPGKLFQNNIDHMINKVVEFIDSDKPQIKIFSGKYRDRMFNDIRDKMDDELRVMIQGHRTSAYCTFSSHIQPMGQFVKVYGSKSAINADFIHRTVISENSTTFPSAIGRMLEAFIMAKKYRKQGWRNLKKFIKSDFHYFVGLNKLINDYYESIIYDREPPISYDNILKVSWIMEEIFNQLNQHQHDDN